MDTFLVGIQERGRCIPEQACDSNQWRAGKCLTTSSRGRRKKSQFVVLANFHFANNFMADFKLPHEVITPRIGKRWHATRFWDPYELAQECH